jgi:glycerophosphoryl diester phosphodiesterase
MQDTNLVITQGHRGARGVLPENSIAGFAHALDAGLDRIEIDVNLSADDRLLVVHDETTNPDLVRDPRGRWLETRIPWRSLEYHQVAQFDVGRIRPESRYAERFPLQQPLDGTRIPVLEEVADLIRQRRRGSINIELKCDPAAPAPRPDVEHFAGCVVAAIAAAKIRREVTVQSFNWSMVAAVRRLDPELVTGCLSSELTEFDTIGRSNRKPGPWTHGLHVRDFNGSVPAMVKAMGVDYWSSEHRDLDEQAIDAAHALGLAVHAWTVNDADTMKKLISWHTDSIISDFPETLLAVVREQSTNRSS